MNLNFYEFRSDWHLEAPPDDVYKALEQLDDYPSWWRAISAVRQTEEAAAEITARSVLPYNLVFTARQRRRDPHERVLEASLEGDLEGFSRWTISEGDRAGTSVAVFTEEVTANKALLRRLAFLARPAFRANHSLMMCSGRRGLSTYLAGWQRGRHPR